MSALLQLTLIVLLVLGIIGLMALRRRVLARMALRNIVRRRKFTAIIVVGLLIATSMISAALVVGDTIDYLIKGDVYESTGEIDIVVTVEDEEGINQFFNESLAYDLIGQLDIGAFDSIDEVAPAIREVASVLNPAAGASSPYASVYAFDPEHLVNDLEDTNGDPIGTDKVTGGRTAVNEDLADTLKVGVGDTILVYPKNGLPVQLEVSAVAAEEGMGTWNFADLLFLDLEYAQEFVFEQPGMITSIDVSCKGSVEKGYLLTDQAVEELETELGDEHEFTYNTVKKDGVETAESVSDMLSQLFVLMSSFTIIAGIALIVNIFVMLAEERKPEMGISRAVGMQRGDLTQTFVFEGVVYAVVASAMGAFVGLGIAFIMINAFSAIIGGEGLTWTLHFEWYSLALAGVAGFLITVLTVIVASWRVSRLNIVRAIRDIPEPVMAKSGKRYMGMGLAVLMLGVMLALAGKSSHQAAATTSGVSLIAAGAAMVSVRFVNPRIPFTIAGAWMIYWILDPVDIGGFLFGRQEGNLEMFVISGVVMVTGAVFIAMFNSDLMLEGLVKAFGRGRNLLPVFRAAISYPMNKKFRTGLTLFIFSLIMFTVIVIAMIASFQRESVDTLSEKFSGGFEIVGYSLREVPETNLTDAMDEVNETLDTPAVARIETASTAVASMSVRGSDEEPTNRQLVGFSDRLLSEGRFSLMHRADAYASDEDAWNALREHDDLTILDGTAVPSMFTVTVGAWYVDLGEVVVVSAPDGTTRNLTVIGIMDQMLVNGVFTSKSFVQELPVRSSENLFYVDTVPGTGLTDEQVREALEESLAEFGLGSIVVKDIVEEAMSMSASTMQLMELFLGVGLVVGIAGLGIITIRNIAERRQEVGVMRAIGFQRNMILNTFLVETSFVALLGIISGVVLGLLLSYRLFDWGGFSEISVFVIPWGEVLLVLLIAFTMTILSTLPPSRRAARLAPAEALRRVD